jgi:glutamate/tyrosine decarboxylase-like PLP-dependent enzyme
MKLPKNGLIENPQQIFKILKELESKDLQWDKGKAFGYVFDPGKKYRKVGEKALLEYYHKSGLDFTVYPSLLYLEKEIVNFAIRHLNGDRNCCGNFTSGGTESILLAVKTARDYALSKNSNIKNPEILLPITAHASFHKAAKYFNLNIKLVNISDTYQVDLNDLEKKISRNTILIVGSAPSYTFGVIDPIEEMAKIAEKYNVLFHVDACMGGFILPFFRKLKIPIPRFDFSLKGVSSISMDFHKYAYAPKGSSVILYRNKELRKYQIFSCSNWIGYTMINSTIQSTKSGGPLAATYATLLAIGEDGYLNFAKEKWNAILKIQNFIKNHPDLKLVVESNTPLIAFTSDTVNIFHIIDEMNLMGWYIQPVFSYGKIKESIHLSINYSNVYQIEKFLKDLNQAIENAKKLPSGILLNEIKPYLNQLDNLKTVYKIFQGLNIQPDRIPKRFAPINEVLNLLKPEVREKILLEFTNLAFP